MAATTEPTVYAFTPGLGLGNSFATQTVTWSGVDVSLPQFDTLGGTRTLVSVALSYDIYVAIDQQIENNANTARSQILETAVGGTIRYDGAGAVLLTLTPVSYFNNSGLLSATDNSGVANSSGPDFNDFAVISASQSGSSTVVGSLVSFIGGGFITLETRASASVQDPDLNNWTIGSSALGNARVGVTYTWEPTVVDVPEASTYAAALGLVGMVGFGWVRSRR